MAHSDKNRVKKYEEEALPMCTSWITSRRMVYIAFFLHGIAQLFSSNAVTNSSSFFIKHVSKSNLGFMVMDYLFVVLTTARLLFLLVSNYLLSWVIFVE